MAEEVTRTTATIETASRAEATQVEATNVEAAREKTVGELATVIQSSCWRHKANVHYLPTLLQVVLCHVGVLKCLASRHVPVLRYGCDNSVTAMPVIQVVLYQAAVQQCLVSKHVPALSLRCVRDNSAVATATALLGARKQTLRLQKEAQLT